jgi:hypothetical protein
LIRVALNDAAIFHKYPEGCFVSTELTTLEAHLARETEVLENCKQTTKGDPTPANQAFLRDALEHVRLLTDSIRTERERLALLH